MNKKLTFIDLFAGCGGLSLGLINAGFKGLFAIEKNQDAFSTLIHNLSDEKLENGFTWPNELPCKNMTTSELLTVYIESLKKLSGKVDLVAGGPPCQGFSFVGLRNPEDPRNRLTEEYIEIVSILKPKILLLENVKGFQAPFKNAQNLMKSPYADFVTEKLESHELGYKVFRSILPASEFAVPQPRPRFVMIAIRKDIVEKSNVKNISQECFFNEIKAFCQDFKKQNKLNLGITSVQDAIADLKILNKEKKACTDCKGFEQINYTAPKKLNPYLAYLRRNCKPHQEPNSMRIPKHRSDTKQKFEYILVNSEKGRPISNEIRERFSMKKQCFRVLSAETLATTITTSPDDCLHYDEARILTARENARLQSFPDDFEFQGNYTTGGLRRREDCPRYTQIGNAVPPLMAEILGSFIKEIVKE